MMPASFVTPFLSGAATLQTASLPPPFPTAIAAAAAAAKQGSLPLKDHFLPLLRMISPLLTSEVATERQP